MTAGGLTQGESMTPHTGFNLFGKIEGIYQNVKITPLKKITADEVEFFSSEEKFDMYSEFRRFMKDKNILKDGKIKMKGCKSRRTGNSFDAVIVMFLGEDNKPSFKMEFDLGIKLLQL